MVFIGKNKAKLSRFFFFSPFFSVLSAFAPAAPQTHESGALYRDDFALATPRRKRNAAWRLCLAKNSVRKIFAAQVGESKSRRQTANPTNLPQFWASRVAIETLCSANASPKFFVPKIFAAQPWRKKVPKANLGRRRFQQQVASETLRGAYASLKIRYAKFSRPKLGKASPEGTPRIQPTCHNFGPPALQSKRCVAPMLRQIFRSQNFRDATLEEEGSEGKPYKEKGSNDKPRTKPTALPVACVKLAKAKLSPKKPHVF